MKVFIEMIKKERKQNNPMLFFRFIDNISHRSIEISRNRIMIQYWITIEQS